MKICQITNVYPPYIFGGAEIYVEKIARQLQSDNQVIVITGQPYKGLSSFKPSWGYQDRIKVYRFYPLNLPPSYYKKTAFLKYGWFLWDVHNIHSSLMVKKILQKESPDVVHSHGLQGLSPSVMTAVADLGLAHIHTIHNYHLICPRGTLLHKNSQLCDNPGLPCKIYRLINKKQCDSKVDLVTAPSFFAIQKHQECGFFRTAACRSIPLGIDFRELDGRQKTRQKGEQFDILYMGAVSKHKGVRILLEAFSLLKGKGYVLHVAGVGDDLDYCHARGRGIDGVTFHGFVGSKEKSHLLESADVMVVPSIWYDNSPLTIYESFSYSLPVLASRIGGIPELVKEGINGYLFSPGNSRELAALIEKLARDRAQLENLSQNARNSILPFEMGKHVALLMDTYQELLSSKKQRKEHE